MNEFGRPIDRPFCGPEPKAFNPALAPDVPFVCPDQPADTTRMTLQFLCRAMMNPETWRFALRSWVGRNAAQLRTL